MKINRHMPHSLPDPDREPCIGGLEEGCSQANAVAMFEYLVEENEKLRSKLKSTARRDCTERIERMLMTFLVAKGADTNIVFGGAQQPPASTDECKKIRDKNASLRSELAAAQVRLSDIDKLNAELDAARKRIQELEAEPVSDLSTARIQDMFFGAAASTDVAATTDSEAVRQKFDQLKVQFEEALKKLEEIDNERLQYETAAKECESRLLKVVNQPVATPPTAPVTSQLCSRDTTEAEIKDFARLFFKTWSQRYGDTEADDYTESIREMILDVAENVAVPIAREQAAKRLAQGIIDAVENPSRDVADQIAIKEEFCQTANALKDPGLRGDTPSLAKCFNDELVLLCRGIGV